MPKRITKTQKQRLYKLVTEGGLPVAEAAARTGMSRSTAFQILRGIKYRTEAARLEQLASQPDPRTWDQLSTDAQEALRDFSVFCEMFFVRRTPAWRRDAAMRVVEALHTPKREFVVVNVFPGSGKTTLFTHDIPAWLIAGGGVCDPAEGRAIRMLLGAQAMGVAEHYVTRLRDSLEREDPFYDHNQHRRAEISLTQAYGRFRPLAPQGRVWRADQFTVEPLGGFDSGEKEPTVQAASREKGFLGERVELAVWDDLVTPDNSRTPDAQAGLAAWFEDQAEARLEPGGVLLLVGQRFGPHDLFRNRLDVEIVDPSSGEGRKKYSHIVYPAHHDDLCDGDHRAWDGGEEGCLTDPWRLPWEDVVEAQSKGRFRTVYQQEDVDPERALVHPAWIDGGRDPWGVDCPGSLDKDRAFFEHPEGVGKLVNYACVDPAAGLYWVIEWWAARVEEPHVRYLIFGERSRLQAGEFLDWDAARKTHIGLMEELQVRSVAMGQPIKAWVIESVAAFRHLLQYEHFRTWCKRWPDVAVIPHETQRNKHHAQLGVEALLPNLYRSGLKRLPYRQGEFETVRYVKVKKRELTTYPDCTTEDTVMADWFGEIHFSRILDLATRKVEPKPQRLYLPPYLVRQRLEKSYVEEQDAVHV